MTAPDLTLDLSGLFLIRSDLVRMSKRYGGRTPYGHSGGILTVGADYWTGTVEFERQSRGGHPAGIAQIEAAIAELQDSSKTFRVPMPKQGRPLVVCVDSANNALTLEQVEQVGALRIAAGGALEVPVVGGRSVKIDILPGTRLTVDHDLYMATHSGGMQTVTAAAPKTVPEWPAAAAGKTVDVASPYAVGRIAADGAVPMQRAGSWGGPWRIAWEQA